MDTVPIDY